MTLVDLLPRAIEMLESEQVPYMLTGSIASSFYGEVRSTRDIDIVIDPDPGALERLISRLRAEGLYADRDAARVALAERGQFNAVLGESKIDFVIRKETPFGRTEFGRRRHEQLPGFGVDIVAVEDLILTKLVWASQTDSERHRRDVAGMLNIWVEQLDREYLVTWAEELGVPDALERMLAEEGMS